MLNPFTRFFRRERGRTGAKRPRPLSQTARPLRETPPDVLRWLRLISPKLDCYYLGEGRWGIVELQDDTLRRRIGEKMQAEARTPSQRLVADLMADGFSLLMVVEGPEPTSAIVPRLRGILAASEKDVDLALEDATLVSEGEGRRLHQQAFLDDYKHYEVLRHRYPFVFRGRRSFSNAGRPRG